MAVVAYVLVRTRFYSIITDKTFTVRNQIYLILLFGVFTMYGATSAIPVAGGFVALGHIGQIVGGLLAGPLVGAGVGLISAGYRWTLDGFSVVPASLAALLAGVFAGLYAKWKKDFRFSPGEVAVLTVVIELFASGLTLLLVPDFDQALLLEKRIRLPMTIGHVLAGAVFILIINNMIEERKTREAKERIESELKIAREIQMSMVPKTFPPFPNAPEFDLYAVLEPAKEVGGDFALSKNEASVAPHPKEGKKWRIGYCESNRFVNYAEHLYALVRGLSELGGFPELRISLIQPGRKIPGPCGNGWPPVILGHILSLPATLTIPMTV